MRAWVYATPANQLIPNLPAHWLQCIYITVVLAEMRTALRADECELHRRAATNTPYKETACQDN